MCLTHSSMFYDPFSLYLGSKIIRNRSLAALRVNKNEKKKQLES